MSRREFLHESVRQGLLSKADADAMLADPSKAMADPTLTYAEIGQGSAVADATGGTTVDAEARAAINGLLAQLRTLGIIAT